ncbi:MAG TPA: hypothetical protein VJ765_11530 [Chitinophagaceae bacterium]|nr:hypothetical protein [Chitinophagaceae bacterium]
MKKTLHITTKIDQPGFLEDMVEKLASTHNGSRYNNQKLSTSKRTFETSSAETYVSGTIIIDDSNEQINMPFITSFLFTCIQEKDGRCKLEWASSLS